MSYASKESMFGTSTNGTVISFIIVGIHIVNLGNCCIKIYNINHVLHKNSRNIFPINSIDGNHIFIIYGLYIIFKIKKLIYDL